MKFVKIKVYFLFLVTLICLTNYSFNFKAKKSESMMNYLNSFFAESAEQSRFKHKAKNYFNFHQKFYEPSPQNTTDNSTVNNSTDSEDVLSDWFEISSPSFKSADKFPTVMMSDGSEKIIQCDSNFFRINSAFEQAQNEDKPPTKKFFWFRLSGLHVYYSATPSDINVLGAISIKSISSVFPADPDSQNDQPTFCIHINDIDKLQWNICALKEETTKKWACRIKKLLGIDDEDCSNSKSAERNITVVEKKITQPIIIMPLPSRQCNEDWNYQANGDDWECDCQGKEQSPINLPQPIEAMASPVKPLFQYQEVSYKEGKPLNIVYEENMLKIKYDRFGKLVTMDGTVYYAQEIQIHTPAEHTIDGKTFEMEIQILHIGVSKGDLSKSALLCFLIEKVPGVYNKFIDDLDFFNLPNALNKEKKIQSNLFLPKIFYSADEDGGYGMKPFSFYTYQGSLTSPPCLENTIIYVASNPIQLGSTAIKLFQEALRIPDTIDSNGDITASSMTPMSHRKTQPQNGRPVFFYNHVLYCGPDPTKPEPKQGHYEKVQKSVTNYFYINSNSASGLPGSFVVSESEARGEKNVPQ
jgi:carbonic anhydrase